MKLQIKQQTVVPYRLLEIYELKILVTELTGKQQTEVLYFRNQDNLVLLLEKIDKNAKQFIDYSDFSIDNLNVYGNILLSVLEIAYINKNSYKMLVKLEKE